LSTVFGRFFLILFSWSSLFLVIPLSLKLLPISINICMFIYLLLFIYYPRSHSKSLFFVGSNMLLLTSFILSVRSFCYYKLLFVITKDQELGLINHCFNVGLSKILARFLLFFFNLYTTQPFFFILFFLIFFFFF
jgi:hypothetical protein